MRMLLTSSGITNDSIRDALESLMKKSFSESNLVYIPTATVIEKGDHTWFVQDLNRLYNLGWKEFNVMELNGISHENITERLQNADVIFAEGGNVYHLAHSIASNSLTDAFLNALKDKVYVGASAGSMLFSNHFDEHAAQIFNEMPQLLELGIDTISSPFNFFDWYLKPHLNAADFPERTDEWIEEIAQKANFPIYAIDDESAIKIIDDSIGVISQGKWRYFDPSSSKHVH